MKNDKDLYQQIDDYLDGAMSPADHHAFEQEISRDTLLSEEVELYRMANTVVKASASNELRREIQTGIKIFDRKAKIKNWAIAALLVALTTGALLTYLVLKQEKSVPAKRLNTQAPAAVEQNKTVVVDSVIEIKVIRTTQKPITVTGLENTNSNNAPDSSEAPILLPTQKNTVAIDNTNPVQKTEEKPISKPIDCSDFGLKTNPEIIPTCPNKYDGAIDFSHTIVIGGKEPYTLTSSISNTTTLERFANLPAGNYSFTLSDANGCHKEIDVTIPEKNCRQKNFIINTPIGESWMPPVDNSETYDLQIIDEKGKVILSQNQIRNWEWKGTDQYGQIVPSGLYVYLIKFDDQKVHSGQITIIR